MQTAWIWMRRRVTRRLPRIQAVCHSDTISPTLSHFEALWRLRQTKNFCRRHFFGGLRVNKVNMYGINLWKVNGIENCEQMFSDRRQLAHLFYFLRKCLKLAWDYNVSLYRHRLVHQLYIAGNKKRLLLNLYKSTTRPRTDRQWPSPWQSGWGNIFARGKTRHLDHL